MSFPLKLSVRLLIYDSTITRQAAAGTRVVGLLLPGGKHRAVGGTTGHGGGFALTGAIEED
jgi:hypothetical protein